MLDKNCTVYVEPGRLVTSSLTVVEWLQCPISARISTLMSDCNADAHSHILIGSLIYLARHCLTNVVKW